MIEETTGGMFGDWALSAIVPSALFVIIAIFVFGIRYLTMDTYEDFQVAKSENKTVQCQSLIKTYTIGPKDYSVEENHIVMNRLIRNKKFLIADCSIK